MRPIIFKAFERRQRFEVVVVVIAAASACACAGSSRASSEHVAALVSSTLAGFSAAGEALLRRTFADGSISFEAMTLPSGPLRRISPEALGDPPSPIPERTIGGLRVDLEVTRPLGGRGEAVIMASYGGKSFGVGQVALATGELLEAGPLWAAPGGRYAVLEVRYERGAGLEVVDLSRARSLAINARALEHYFRGEGVAAASLWEEAMALDATYGDPIYNLACLHARGGDLARAKDELALALAIEPLHYARIARGDSDLADLLDDPEVRRWLALH